jgi:hypothetical protein
MSEALIEIQERRGRIRDYQQNGHAYLNPGQLLVKSIGILAEQDPDAAMMEAEAVDEESVRINALVAVGEETDDIGLLYDAIAIAQSSSAIQDPRKRSAKLGYIARHAAGVDRSLALGTAHDIESPTTRATTLLHLTPLGESEETSQLLQEVADIVMQPGASFDSNFYWRYLHRTSHTGNYEMGLQVCSRRLNGRIQNYPNELETKKHRYVAECVLDAFESSQRDYRDLTPIATDVVELFEWCAKEGFTSSTRYRDPPFPYNLGHLSYREHFHLITEGLKIAESFAQKEDVKSSRALLRSLKKLIDNSIKDPSPDRL